MAADMQNSIYIQTSDLTVADLAKEYLDSVKKTMKPSTYAMYENYVLNEVVPKIGGLAAMDFNREGLESFLAKCLYSRDGKTRRSQNTMYAIEEILRAMFQYGMQKGLISEVPLGKNKYERQKTENDVIILSKWQIQKLVKEARQAGQAQEIQVMLPLYLGITLSELSGLKWEDVDLESRKIHIHHCLKRLTHKNPDNSTSTSVISYELDKREQRMIHLPTTLQEILEKAYHSDLSETPKQERTWFVSSLDYKFIEGRTLQYRLKNLGDKAGIQKLTYRCLRDTFAVLSIRAGANVKTLAEVLGVNMKVVCDRYGEWMGYDDGFLERMG